MSLRDDDEGMVTDGAMGRLGRVREHVPPGWFYAFAYRWWLANHDPPDMLPAERKLRDAVGEYATIACWPQVLLVVDSAFREAVARELAKGP